MWFARALIGSSTDSMSTSGAKRTTSANLQSCRMEPVKNKEVLTCGGHMCCGNGEKVNKYLNTATHAHSMPVIPKEHIYGSSVIHPEDHCMSWLVHTKAVPMQPNSRQQCQSSAGQPVEATVLNSPARPMRKASVAPASATRTSLHGYAKTVPIAYVGRRNGLTCQIIFGEQDVLRKTTSAPAEAKIIDQRSAAQKFRR